MSDPEKKVTDEQEAANEPAKATATDPDPDVPPAAPHPTPAETAVETETTSKKKVSRLDRFLRKTGFDRDDVDVVHENAGIFGTVQGGKYKLAKTGEIITLKGPVPTPPEETEG
jgi:hypothetical protein